MVKRFIIFFLVSLSVFLVGFIGAGWMWSRSHLRYAMPGTGFYHGFVTGVFESDEEPFFHLCFLAETLPCWYLEQPIQGRIQHFLLGLARIFHSHIGKSREKPYEKRGANTFECVVETTRHAGLETCDTAGWEACATMVCHGFAGFTMKYPG